LEKENVISLNSLLNRRVVTAGPKDSLAKVGSLMEQENVGAVVVTESDRPVGIITDRDLALAACVRGTSPDERVQSVMFNSWSIFLIVARLM
jgi:CBS domain-containing protein